MIFCIDLKSFYASVECVLRGLDPFKVNLVVADVSRGQGSIVLAASPHIKQFGVKSRCRIYDLPKDLKIIFAKPRMKKYIEYASKIYEVYLRYVDRQDVHIYSIDEAFLDLTHYMNYYKMPPISLAKKILADIMEVTGITATCGIGENMFQAKVALDCLAKHSDDYVAYLDENLFKQKMWDYKPLGDIWGIGRQLEVRLHRMGIDSLRDLANYSEEKLEKTFGILGNELYEHAHGRDSSIVSEVRNYKPQSKSFGHGQVLYEDYNYLDMITILTEYVDEIATELVMRNLNCQLIGLGIGYSRSVKDGFSRQMTLSTATNSRKVLLAAFKKLYFDHVKDYPIRRIQVRVGKLSTCEYVQTDLFSDSKISKKEHDLYATLGEIQEKYGKKAVSMAVSYTEKATQRKRSDLVGGHNAE